MYLIGGIIYNKVQKGATGKEVIPNVQFWTESPILVKVKVNFYITIFQRNYYRNFSNLHVTREKTCEPNVRSHDIRSCYREQRPSSLFNIWKNVNSRISLGPMFQVKLVLSCQKVHGQGFSIVRGKV